MKMLIMRTVHIFHLYYCFNLDNLILLSSACSFIYWIYSIFFGEIWAFFSEDVFMNYLNYDHIGNIKCAKLTENNKTI